MFTKDELCRTIRTVSPDVGPCGENIQTGYDEKNQAWVVTLKQGHRELKTYVDQKDAADCMEGRQCLGLGLEVYQLKDNLGFKGGQA